MCTTQIAMLLRYLQQIPNLHHHRRHIVTRSFCSYTLISRNNLFYTSIEYYIFPKRAARIQFVLVFRRDRHRRRRH